MDFNQRFVALDIETTGLTYEYFDEPTEIALVEIIDGKFTGNNKHYFLKPKKKVTLNFLEKVFGKDELKKTKTSSLDDALLKVKADLKKSPEDEGLKSLKESIEFKKKEAETMLVNINKGSSRYAILPEVRKFIGDSIVIGHNVSFDVNFLNFYFMSQDLPLIEKYICTFKSFKEHFNFKKNNLTECCNYYGIKLEGAHNALDDTIACSNLFFEEIKDFPDDIKFFDYDKIDAYISFKKRVVDAKYFDLTKKVLEETCSANDKLVFDDEELKKKIFKMFDQFKKPVQVSKVTGIGEFESHSLFLQWVNCININKHLDFIREKYLSSFCKEVLTFTNSNYNDIRRINIGLFENEPNYFIYKLYEKLDFRKDEMSYTLDDLNYYFNNAYTVEDLNKKIEKGEEFIAKFLIEWLGDNTKRINQYKNYLKDMYNKSTKEGLAVKKYIDLSPNKNLYIL